MLELDYPIKDLVGADYNPRQIDEESLKTLRDSIKTLGIVKPIIVSGNLIVAGHQRTKALLAAGIDKAPVYLLPKNINQTDEIRFNQLHNGTDFDSGDERAWVGRSENLGFEMVPPIKLRGNMRAKMANVRNEICKLIIKYGNWGACVATQAGKVIHAGQYVLACRAMGIPARVYRIPNDKAKIAEEFLNKKYGKFSYEHSAPRCHILLKFQQACILQRSTMSTVSNPPPIAFQCRHSVAHLVFLPPMQTWFWFHGRYLSLHRLF